MTNLNLKGPARAALLLAAALALAGCRDDASTPPAAAPAATQPDTATQVADARANGHEEGMEMERESHERGMEMSNDAHQATAAHPGAPADKAMPSDPAMPMKDDMPMKDPPKADPKPDPAMPMSDM